MRRLTRALLAAFAALGLAISMMAAAAAVCPDGTMPAAGTRAAHDCAAPAPDSPESDPHEPCRMLAPCVSIDLGRASVTLASIAHPSHQVPAARTSVPPATIARGPAPPPPRA